MIHQLTDLWLRGWRSLVEILLLWVAIYYGYLYFRGTRGDTARGGEGKNVCGAFVASHAVCG